MRILGGGIITVLHVPRDHVMMMMMIVSFEHRVLFRSRMRNLCKITYAERDESLERERKRIQSMTISGNNVKKEITSSLRSIALE
jgi:hypothetical protein